MISRPIGRDPRICIRRWAGFALTSALLALPGCRGSSPAQDPGLLLDVGFSPTPPAVGPARLIITLRDTLGQPLDGAEIHVEGNMSHAGMTPVIDTAVAQGSGTYSVPDFTFSMAGEWIVTVSATLPDGRRTVVQAGTNVVGAPPGFSHEEDGREPNSPGSDGSATPGPASPAPGAFS